MWEERAACRGNDINLFFTDSTKKQAWAKEQCAHCPVTQQCLQTALKAESTEEPRYGIFGGLTGEERRRLGPRRTNVRCSVEGCERRRDSSLGYCSTHKYRAEHGIPLDKPIKKELA